MYINVKLLIAFLLVPQSSPLFRVPLLPGDGAKVFYLKMVDEDADGTDEGRLIAFATWKLLEAPKTSDSDKGTPPPGMNHSLTTMIDDNLGEMRNRVSQGRECFCESAKHRPIPYNWTTC